MTHEETVAYIHRVSWRGSKQGLERITELCERLGNPQDNLRFIHVAGTNGKGSFCAMMTEVLIKTGKRVGTFTSPYILRFNDRMCVNGTEISDGELSRLVEKIMPIAEAMDDKPTEFELITALGFLWFAEQKCDIVVLEAGMGGRFDSTNVIKKALLSVITGIALDHTAILGDTLEKIAWEKAGIIKAGCPVIVGEADGGALAVIENEAEKLNSPLIKVDYSQITVLEQCLAGTKFDFGTVKNCEIALLGSYQPRNAANVVTAAKILGISECDIKAGLKKARWRARFEIVSHNPLIVYDGGHNIQGVTLCVDSVEKYLHRKVNLITGVMRDKAYMRMSELFAPVCETVTTLTPDNPRSLPAEEYAAVFERLGIRADYAADEAQAVKKALLNNKENGLPILCAGSLYMYEKLLPFLKNNRGDCL